MTQFTQLHFLTFYPPSNLNRDDLGRPKTAVIGNRERLRISSQCLKRTWRTHPLMQEALAGKLGHRTRRIGTDMVLPILREAGVSDKNALAWSKLITDTFAKTEDKKEAQLGETKQLVHISPAEEAAVRALAQTLAGEKREPTKEELQLLRKDHAAVDIAMFGRMLADHPGYNMDAAVQVSHAFTVNAVAVEDDFFTAVDDLNTSAETGSGHMGETWFGSGVFYLYVCINRDLLTQNLNGDSDLAARAVRALVETAAKASPSGKQNSFAAHSRAGFILAEKGTEQPRSLAAAFIQPLGSKSRSGFENNQTCDLLGEAVTALTDLRRTMDDAYEVKGMKQEEFYPVAGSGTLSGLLDFVAGP